jgi:hypothetical protein
MSVFKYDLSIADMEAFWDAELTSEGRRGFMVMRLAYAWGGAYVAYMLARRWLPDPILAGVIAAITAIAVFLTTGGLVRRLYRRAIRRRYLRSPDTDLGSVALSLAPDYFEVTGVSTQSRTAWSGVRKLVVTPAHAFIHLGPWKAVIVPLSQLDVSTRAELLKLLRAYSPAEAAVA